MLGDTPDLLRDIPGIKKERKIVMIVNRYAQNGISHSELAKSVGIDRKNLRRYTKRLIAKRVIKRGLGMQGRYYPSDKAHRGTNMYADILSIGASVLLLEKDDLEELNSPFFKNLEKFELGSPFFNNIEGGNPLESFLFNFSNKVGSIIIYLMIQAMNPSNRVSGNATNSSKEKDLDIEWWINDAFLSLSRLILPVFKNHLSKGLLYFCESLRNYFTNSSGSFDISKFATYNLNLIYREPRYTLDKGLISDLMAALNKTYPGMTTELERIRSEIPRIIDTKISQWEHQYHRYNTQKNCKHRFEPPENRKLLRSMDGKNLIHCKKCHKTRIKKV